MSRWAFALMATRNAGHRVESVSKVSIWVMPTELQAKEAALIEACNLWPSSEGWALTLPFSCVKIEEPLR